MPRRRYGGMSLKSAIEIGSTKEILRLLTGCKADKVVT